MIDEPVSDDLEESASARTARGPVPSRARLVQALWRDLRGQGPVSVARKTAGVVRRERQRLRYRFNLRRLGYRLDSVPIDRPLFFLGIQGGGGTILTRCLQRHPKTVYASGNSELLGRRPTRSTTAPHLYDVPEALVHRTFHFGTVNHTVANTTRATATSVRGCTPTDEFLPQLLGKTADDVDEQTTTRSFRARAEASSILAYAHDPGRLPRGRPERSCTRFRCRTSLACSSGSNPHFVLVARNPYATVLPRRGQGVHGCARRLPRGGSLGPDRLRGRALEQLLPARARLRGPRADAHRALRGVPRRPGPRRARPSASSPDWSSVDGPRPAEGPPGSPAGSVEPEKWYPLKRGENERYMRRARPRADRRAQPPRRRV